MPKTTVIALAAALLLGSPATAVEDGTWQSQAQQDEARQARKARASQVQRDPDGKVPVVLDVLFMRPAALVGALFRLPTVALLGPPGFLKQDTREVTRFIFRDPIGHHPSK